MDEKIFLIIENSNDYQLTEEPPMDLSDFRQHGGPFAGMVPFFTVFAHVSVGGQRVAEIASSFIKNEP